MVGDKVQDADNKFKTDFKYFKRKKPPPCLDNVLDPLNPLHSHHFTPLEVEVGVAGVGAPPHTQPVCHWKVWGLVNKPGLRLVTGVMDLEQQEHWAGQCLTSYCSRSSSRRNLDALGDLGEGDWWTR